MLPFCCLFFIFIFSLQQFEFIVNTFPFVFEVVRLFYMYFMIGAALACASYRLFLDTTSGSKRKALWVCLAIFFVAQGTMLGLMEVFISVHLTAACALIAGCSLMMALLTTVAVIFNTTLK
jgi:hypothetical protein